MRDKRRERVVDRNRLRRSCVDCSLRLPCLPAGVSREDVGRLDEIVRMSREDIASYLGLALETVSRLLTRLSEEGVIAVDRRRPRIRDRAALAAAAGRAAASPGRARDCRVGA